MTIFLYGPDGYRLKENVDTIVDTYHKKYENSVSHYCFDFTSPTCKGVDEVSNAIKSVSFFDETKLVVIKNPFVYGSQTSINGLGELIKDFKISEDKKIVLVFVENKSESDLRKADKDLFALLGDKNNLVRNFEYLDGAKLSNWVRDEFKKYGHGVSIDIANLLIRIVGNESWALANEINKLSNYLTSKTCYNGPCLLTKEDINLLVSRKEDVKIFDLVDAVGNQNRAKAFEMMYRLTNSGQDPHYLLSMLVYHFENLLSVSDGSIPKHLHPFVARKAASQARRFSKEELLSKFNYLAELDIASKNGQVNLEDALYNFVVS